MPRVIDIAHSARLTQMLGRIEEARRASQHATDKTELEDEVARLYLQVGRYVHWLLRQSPETVARIENESRAWAATYDAAAGIEAVDIDVVEEVEVDIEMLDDAAEEISVLELTADSEASSVDIRMLDNAAAGDRHTPRTLGGDEAVDVSEYDELVDEAPAVTDTQPIPKVTSPDAWRDTLRMIVRDLGAPTSPIELGVRRIVQATTRVEARWSQFPPMVQTSLARMVAARARFLQANASAEQDAELRLAVGRLRRFSDERDLPLSQALHHDAGARSADWRGEEDLARNDLERALM